MQRPEIAIIGAGPAGMAAAATASALGLAVALLDDQPEPGGQIYRRIGSVAQYRPGLLPILGKEYRRGLALLSDFRRAKIDYLEKAAVWNRDADGTISFSRNGRAHQLEPQHLLIATGAMERPVPIPGATLPGVMGAGALQILLKTGGLLPDGEVVLAGGGPLLLLLAAQYLRAGVRIAAIVETTQRDTSAALRALPRALRTADYLAKGAGLLLALKRHRVPVYRGAGDLRAIGAQRLAAISFIHDGERIELPADLLGLHEGVVPHSQLARALGCGHRWDHAQACFRPALTAWGESDQAGIWIAGDAGGIGGAQAAECQGRLTVLEIATRLGHIDTATRDRLAAKWRRGLNRHLAIRPLLDRLYAPGLARQLDDEAIICRCEEVQAVEIRATAAEGCSGPNQAKSFLRCGMGPCQGRMCGLAVTQILAQAHGITPEESGYYRIRAPIQPVTLNEMANLGDITSHELATADRNQPKKHAMEEPS